jgi:hypothetical protein
MQTGSVGGKWATGAHCMKKRPLSVTVTGCLYLATGAVGIAFQLIAFKPQHPFRYDIVWVGVVDLIAILCGIYILRGTNWARWAALAWIAFHVVLSGFHSWFEFVVHSLLCAAVAYFLFRSRATQYFCAARTPER